jgi:hypothetical protein
MEDFQKNCSPFHAEFTPFGQNSHLLFTLFAMIWIILHQACWPTSSRHARLSTACLFGATSDNNLNDGSNSMSMKTEIMSLRLAEEMIFSLCARSHTNRVGFYTIPYIRAHIFALALLMPESINFQCQKESHHILDHFVHDGHWMTIGWPLDGKYLYLLSV